MTKEITNAFILQQIEDKFKLRDLVPDIFSFSEMVVPVYNIEQHLNEWHQQYHTDTVTEAGPSFAFAIPQDERWTLKRYDVVFMSGDFTVAGMYLVRLNRSPSDAYVYLDLAPAKSVSYHIETDVVLTRGDTLYMNVDGFTSGGNIRVYIDYLKEKIR